MYKNRQQFCLYLYNINNVDNFNIEVRYPDDFYIPTIEEARESIELAEKAKEFVLKKLLDSG